VYNARNRCIELKINGYVTGRARGIPETKEDVYGEGMRGSQFITLVNNGDIAGIHSPRAVPRGLVRAT